MYLISILPNALVDLSKIDKTAAKRVTDKLTWLSKNIEIITPAPLKGTFYNFQKLRIGDWRVILEGYI